MKKIIKIIKNEDLGVVLLKESMKFHTTIRVGGEVSCLYIPNNLEALITVLKFAEEMKIQYLILGRGSNLIFPDGKINILVIKTSHIFDDITQSDCDFIIGAGISLQRVSKKLSKMGYSGLEFAGGIPGTLGGAVYMNAGAHTHDMASIIQSVKYIDENLNVITLSNKDCDFSYRNSIFQNSKCIIIEATIRLQKGNAASIFKKMAGNLAYRTEMQPLELPSCGSSFRNPPGEHAGKLIEECGLKGYMIGGAKVSEKHANFIVNANNATARDILNLIEYVQKQVFSKKGIELVTEVEVIKVEHE
ncbi:MAG: UDP-N-acetylmuramate dehydrogenase [Mycoplasmatales bacterium]